MNLLPHDQAELQKIYQYRFDETAAYRNAVWKVLTKDFFSQYISAADTVLDLGCGYGEFINNITCGSKYAMDLNPRSKYHLGPDIAFLEQDCSKTWRIPSDSLDAVFTSNFFEHLPDKKALSETLGEAHRCLRPGGKLIAMGPNIKFTGGAYWDFYDHYLALTELSMAEALRIQDFEVRAAISRFLPYTMVNSRRYPLWVLAVYLKLRVAWPMFGRQFLVIASKRGLEEPTLAHDS